MTRLWEKTNEKATGCFNPSGKSFKKCKMKGTSFYFLIAKSDDLRVSMTNKIIILSLITIGLLYLKMRFQVSFCELVNYSVRFNLPDNFSES